MLNEVNISGVAKKFSELLRGGPVILYIGSNYNAKQYTSILEQYWSCIFTTKKEPEIATWFHSKDRQVHSITEYKQLEENGFQLSRIAPPLIYLNSNDPNFDLELLNPAEEAEYKKNQIRLCNVLSSMMTNSFASLVILGYDHTNQEEIDVRILYSLLYTLGKRSVYFFNIDEAKAKNKYIATLENEQIATLYSCDLGEVLQSIDSQIEDSNDFDIESRFNSESLKYTLYIEGKSQKIKEEIYYDFSRFGQLLTIKNMGGTHVSRTMMVDWFYQFLKLSPTNPQWYGYEPKIKFNITREYEITLLDFVSKMFLKSEGTDKPILICGQTSSGKSIALANLAYQIFHERKYPVIYINNPDLTLNLGSASFNTLSNLMSELESLGTKRILIIWDCSLANCQKDTRMQQLLIDLSNRGRKPFVLVGSAMEQGEKLNRNSVQVQTVYGYYCINAPITLEPNERKELKKLLIDKGKLSSAQVERFMKETTDDNLLSLLYNMVYWIHPQLEHGLGTEVLRAIKDTEQRLQELPPPMKAEKELTVIGNKLHELGFLFSFEKNEIEKKDIDWNKQLNIFCSYIALCSQFKLSMPMAFAMRILGFSATSDNLKIKETIFSAPWLSDKSRTQVNNDDFSVSFRTPIEAKIFLANGNLNPEKQMHLVAEIIHLLASEKNRDEESRAFSNATDLYFSEEIRFVERLIRIVGPNSEINIISSKDSQYHDGAPCIINALAEIREKYKIWEPLLISQEITYIREYYATNNSLTPKERCEWLEKAVELAQDAIEVRHKSVPMGRGYDGLANSISVERTFSEMQLSKIYDELNLSVEKRKFVPIYSEQYDRLYKIINDNPRSSYAYTALLRAFIENSSLKGIDKIMYISDILELVEEAKAHVEEVSNNEEFIKATNSFYNIVDSVTGDTSADKYFHELLERGSASGVYLKAYHNIKQAGIDFKKKIDNKDIVTINAIKSIIVLLENKNTWDIISKHIGCLYMLLRLKWLFYNKKPIFSDTERQLTAMNNSQWNEINILCEQLKLLITNQKDNQRVFYSTTIFYLLGVSKAQIGDYNGAEEAFRSIREESFAKRGRTWTWHILSDESGNPIPFHGILDSKYYNHEEYSGKVYITEMKRLVYYPSLSFIGKSEPKGTADNLCIGTTYTRFTAYSIDKLNRREKNDQRRND